MNIQLLLIKRTNVSANYKNSLLYFSEILCTYIYVQYYRIIYYIILCTHIKILLLHIL